MSTSAEPLSFEDLPATPPGFGLRRLAQAIWQLDGVIALWLDGSYAHGAADRYSDIDLRICVSEDSIGWWEHPDFELLFKGELVGSRYKRFGPKQLLHQVVLANGGMIDLWIQTADQKPPQDSIYIIGCRDPDLRPMLTDIKPKAAEAPKSATTQAVCEIVTSFWIDSSKANKVLFRNLDMIVMIGIESERAAIMRLWYILATGNDTGPQRSTIHGLTQIVRSIDSLQGSSANELLGLPLRNRRELLYSIEANRNEVARVGRILSERLDFNYPTQLENTVRASWTDFLASAYQDPN